MFGFEQLNTRLSSIVRQGKISKIYPERHSARVEFSDREGLVSAEMPVLTLFANKNKSYALPSIGEMVVCLMQSNDLTAGGGFIIGSLYTAETPPPQDCNEDIIKLEIEDETFLQYNRNSHEFKFQFNDETFLTYDGENHKMQFQFNDDTFTSYDGENHKFQTQFNDDTNISYDGENHKFQAEFNDDTNISYDAENHKMQLKFEDGSEITFNDSNLQMKINGEIKISGKNLDFEASGGIKINAGSSVDIKGSRINLN